jgi:hypothetical protein
LNVVPTNKFDPVRANSFANAPESTGGGSTATGTNQATGPRVPTGTGIPTGGGGGKGGGGGGGGTNVGAIVGGVVGGIVVLALIGGGILFFLQKQRRKNKAASNAFAGGDGAGAQFAQVPQTPVTAPYPTPGTPGIKPYDPNDPTTFPVTPAPNYALPYNGNQQPVFGQQPLSPSGNNSYYGSGNDEYGRPQTVYSTNQQYPAPQGPPPHQPGGYTGAAEL